jgi:GAF domain-containing protein
MCSVSDATTTPPVPEESSPPRTSGDIPVTTPDIGAAMAELARTLQREHSSEPATLLAVTTAAVRAVPGAAQAVISLVMRRQKMVQAHAATDPSAGRLDELQTELDDGPCLRAVWEQQTVHIPDMATESRWPRFAAAATQAGVGAMLCFQLFVEGDNLGALNLYGATAGAFTEESESAGLIFATHAAGALAGAQQEHHLSTALASRDIIGQTKGIVMERFHIDADHAFALIARLSQEHNIKLHTIATQLITDATKPTAPRTKHTSVT